jgi:hypothetical protein
MTNYYDDDDDNPDGQERLRYKLNIPFLSHDII